MRRCFELRRAFARLAGLAAAVAVFGLHATAGDFKRGVAACEQGDFQAAAEVFRAMAASEPASGTLQNLGIAEWQSGRVGWAILAWEQALWLDPFNADARQNLAFARKVSQLEAPDLAWTEALSAWLPVNWWPWIAGLTLWFAIGMGMLPGILRWRRASWHQAMAASGLALFLLTVPALFGVHSRSRIGFVLPDDACLRLTPTLEAQLITRLAPGQPGRWIRRQGQFVLIRASHTIGWVQRDEFRLTTEPAAQGGSVRSAPVRQTNLQ